MGSILISYLPVIFILMFMSFGFYRMMESEYLFVRTVAGLFSVISGLMVLLCLFLFFSSVFNYFRESGLLGNGSVDGSERSDDI